MKTERPYRFIISGGGTGGHIYPAIAIANEIKSRFSDAQILFVGAKGKMEMKKVPEAGYKIIGLWISGFQRRISIDNLYFPFKVLFSYVAANRIIKRFKPHAVIGVGGYASGPIMLAARGKKIPSMIQEQNSYAGLTNKRLGKKVEKICVAYEHMDRYFPQNKIVITGNPVRKDIQHVEKKREQALKHYNLKSGKKTILVLGGSLGARTINNSIIKHLQQIIDVDVQLIWQTGKFYFEEMTSKAKELYLDNIRILEFIKEMDLAYAAADVVISRAGALSISELCLVGKPVIFVPSPNVAEDHQTKNAKALIEKNAAVLVKDVVAEGKLVDEVLVLLKDEKRQAELIQNIKQLAKPNATEDIVNELMTIIK
ncbi:undecaprenyldiphospho-muramoylpentapeptide beta-N-acetylglucosaminyltransferase [Fulvivirga sp. 29W222]|uniref:UDP-N-acetylglucosamine--N-acetylmuramyl-(pentapeptide) pyrophosphoryl-undecaprenol N-acetylglucosamine transferase n=1 Tax=Fulvivirga marina TaxID=2494733 RepID=A0A937FWA0_9BACT|nr:undecaprenyldiphospho-muramoylpentapeptide beta-N-acetylglucosaminyltransferase [Fulvivirga marina]MBL6445506.1 undecaprenyldiphospho-muramoylpentapeptide beta-N-acetylglucosaminyltransferase [Fulvivirga marina]